MKLPATPLTPIFTAWLPLAILATLASLLIYVVGQQQLRLGANDIPVQLAEDTSSVLNSGQLPNSIASAQPVDIATSLSPFVITFSEGGQPTDGSGRLGGQLPEVPAGVFAYARHHKDDRITWQPRGGVRIAAVVRHYSGNGGGFVLAGRNLREIEQREALLTTQVLGGWLTMLATVFVTLAILDKHKNGMKHAS